jgi:hypothetical protein
MQTMPPLSGGSTPAEPAADAQPGAGRDPASGGVTVANVGRRDASTFEVSPAADRSGAAYSARPIAGSTTK